MISPSPTALEYDYLIVGGGAAGLSLACHIAQEPRLANKKVLLIEPEERPKMTEPGHFGPMSRVCSMELWRTNGGKLPFAARALSGHLTWGITVIKPLMGWIITALCTARWRLIRSLRC